MQTDNYRGHIAMFTANIIFGLNTPISKTVLSSGYVNSNSLTILRMIGAAALFWLVSAFTKQEKVPIRDIGLMFLASLFGIQLNQILFLHGLSMTSPVDASIVVTMVPILTMIFAAIYLREPITIKKAAGVLLGFSGAIILILGGTSAVSGGAFMQMSGSMKGLLFCLGSCISFATYLTLFRGLISRYSPITLMKWMFLFAAVCSTPLFWRDVVALDLSAMPTEVILRVLYVVVAATFIAYILIPIGQRNLRPTLVSMYNYLQPFVSSVIAIMVGLDVFSWSKGLAAMLIFLGVWLVTRSKTRVQLEAQKAALNKQ